MPRGLPRAVKDNIEKCRLAAIASVEVYNRPGPRFRTAHYVVLIIMAWTAYFHAFFYKKGRKPWYQKKTPGGGVRYIKIDGDPKHWDLSECLKHFFGTSNPAERKNLEFLIGIRNKIEHRHLPQLDASLYGECQAALLNLEEMLSSEFGAEKSLIEQLAVSLQFSQTIPEEKKKAARRLASIEAKSVKEYIEKFRGGLPSTVLNSMKYSFNVFLVPKVANRKSAADIAVEFIPLNEANKDEMERLEKINVLIREKHIPIANLDLFKPGHVVNSLKGRLGDRINIQVHTAAWKFYKVRPECGDPNPAMTRSEFCVYDEVHKDYLYTKAWVEKLAQELANPEIYVQVTGKVTT